MNNKFSIDDNDNFIQVYLDNVSSTTPIFTAKKDEIKLEKYKNSNELLNVINKIFSDIDTTVLTKDDFSQRSDDKRNWKTVNTLHSRFRKLTDALKYGKTKSVSVNKIQSESLKSMIKRIIKEELSR